MLLTGLCCFCILPTGSSRAGKRRKKWHLLLVFGVCSFLSAVKETLAWFTYPAGIAAVADVLCRYNPYPK